MRRLFHGLDEMGLDVVFTGVEALVFFVLFAYAVHSSAASRLEGVPFVGPVVGGLRALSDVVTH